MTTTPAPGWHPDPARRFEHRFWDGTRWTEHVSSRGVRSTDPINPRSDVAVGRATNVALQSQRPESPASDPKPWWVGQAAPSSGPPEQHAVVVASTSGHLSDSAVQRNAEGAIVAALAAKLGFEGALKPKRVRVLGGGFVQLDACSDDESILVEAYARQGKLKGAQIKKVSQDILKLALLKRDPRLRDSRAIAVFASEEARGSVTGWIRSAADQFGIELAVVDIPEALRDEIKSAQARQVMVNAEIPIDDLADDVTLE